MNWLNSLFSNKKTEEEHRWPMALPNVRIVSIHIEKTAGTTFYEDLKKIYGVQKVVRVDTHQHDRLAVNRDFSFSARRLQDAEILHGHIKKDQLQRYFELPQDVSWITWIREPGERVLSSYNYLSAILKEMVDPQKNPDLLKKLKRNFGEYLYRPEARDQMAESLEGFRLNEFSFIGLTHRYSEDMQLLANKFQWPEVPLLSPKNVSPKEKIDLSPEEKSLLRQVNPRDYRLYEEVLKLREINK